MLVSHLNFFRKCVYIYIYIYLKKKRAQITRNLSKRYKNFDGA